MFEEKKPKSNPLLKYGNWLFLILIVLLLIATVVFVSMQEHSGEGLYISEVMLSNSETLEEDSLGTPDWIELYNASDSAISLSGFGLSNHSSNAYLFTFPDVTIEPNSYLIVYFAGDTDSTSSELLCTGFTLSRSGETLYLSSNTQEILEILEVPALDTDVSYARRDDGSWGYCTRATPGYINSTEITDTIA
ncbi:MAG: lamin tail domain-containing protein [Clostridia bacterium]|nr:lamin tail domain-containing protein [Clostridia bacterium]